jgi:hypothetical protein
VPNAKDAEAERKATRCLRQACMTMNYVRCCYTTTV